MTSTTPESQRTPNLTEKLKVGRESRRICLPIDQEMYRRMVSDQEAYRTYLDDCIKRHPELLPGGVERGYKLNPVKLDERRFLRGIG